MITIDQTGGNKSENRTRKGRCSGGHSVPRKNLRGNLHPKRGNNLGTEPAENEVKRLHPSLAFGELLPDVAVGSLKRLRRHAEAIQNRQDVHEDREVQRPGEK